MLGAESILSQSVSSQPISWVGGQLSGVSSDDDFRERVVVAGFGNAALEWHAVGALQVGCQVTDGIRLWQRRGVQDLQCRRRWSVVHSCWWVAAGCWCYTRRTAVRTRGRFVVWYWQPVDIVLCRVRLPITTGIPNCCISFAFRRPVRQPRWRPAQPIDGIRR